MVGQRAVTHIKHHMLYNWELWYDTPSRIVFQTNGCPLNLQGDVRNQTKAEQRGISHSYCSYGPTLMNRSRQIQKFTH